MKICPRNWNQFQHYKTRAPAWIKLHRDLLDDFEFQCLPVASRALAPMLWLLASESKETETGEIDADSRKLCFRLRCSAEEIISALKPLIDGGFFTCDQDASSMLAACKQSDCLEKRREETEKEEEREKPTAPPAPSARRSAVELQTWIDSLPADEQPIPAGDPIFDYAEKVGIPDDYLLLAWEEFRERMAGKRHKDWRAHYRNAVRGNWFKLWWMRDGGECALTTQGEQAKRRHGL